MPAFSQFQLCYAQCPDLLFLSRTFQSSQISLIAACLSVFLASSVGLSLFSVFNAPSFVHCSHLSLQLLPQSYQCNHNKKVYQVELNQLVVQMHPTAQKTN